MKAKLHASKTHTELKAEARRKADQDRLYLVVVAYVLGVLSAVAGFLIYYWL